jgi:PKD domain/PQQ-like domain
VDTATVGNTKKDGKTMNRIMTSAMKRNTVRLFLAGCSISLMMQLFMASPVVAATTLPVLWTAGGLSAGLDSAGQASRIATDDLGNVAVVSGPSGGRDLAVTSYTAAGSFRWRSTVSPSVGTFLGDWVVAAPNGEFAAVGHNIDSHGRPIGSTLVRYASDGTLRWRVDLVALVARLVVDTGGNAYLAFGGQDIQVHKYSDSGVLLWAKGSTGTFIATSMVLSPDETDVVLTGDVVGGATWMTAAFNSATGTRRWQVTAAEGIAARDVQVDATRVYVTGEGNVGVNGCLTVVAYDRATGARLWRTDANPPTCCAIGLRIALAPDGSLVVAGGTSSGGYFDWWIVALDTNGAVRWQARRDAAVAGDEIPAAIFVLADGTTVVSGTGGPVTRDILGNSYMQGVTAGYSSSGTLVWEAFSKLPTTWATALPNGDVCATGGYDALITCWEVPGAVVSNKPPTAVVSATPSFGATPLTVVFSSAGSSDPDGTIAFYSWSFGDGANSAAANPSHTYASDGAYTATLTVTDNVGAAASASVTVTVTPAIAKTLRSTAINLSGKRIGSRVNVGGQVDVRDGANTAVSGVNVSVRWRKPDGTSVTQTVMTGASGTASFSTSGGRGTYTLTVTNLAKSGYTFDATNSILTKSITK